MTTAKVSVDTVYSLQLITKIVVLINVLMSIILTPKSLILIINKCICSASLATLTVFSAMVQT